ncbi:MAG: polymer-forming cytoskeletal protein [Desulfobacterales bacterium]|nr:polymer-forming cytoskeletal protein [Desulfobacterales bacterium]
MLKTNKNAASGKKNGSGKLFEMHAYSKESSRKLSNAKTIIGKDISIQGNIRGSEHMVIDGSVKGNIEMDNHNFTLGPAGRVEGEIHARNISISGDMKGNIKTPGKIEITEQASFQGDIVAKSIAVENGAYFKGSVELITEQASKPLSTEEKTDKRADV